MNYLDALFLLTATLLFFSCNSEEKKLLEKYKEIEKYATHQQYDKMLNELDQRSLAYISYVTDTANLSYEKLKKYGDDLNLELTTLVYHHEIGDIIRQSEKPEVFFLLYLSMSGVPVLNWSSPPKLLEEKTETGNKNFVVVGTKINDNTYITSKVKFTPYTDGSYKLNLLDLMNYRERILFQSYERTNYSNVNKNKTMRFPLKSKVPEGEDKMRYFLENRGRPENQLKELYYNPRIK